MAKKQENVPRYGTTMRRGFNITGLGSPMPMEKGGLVC